jgi:MoaA/NifB/PqqE/SkfB family radical SAM enzyme
VTPEEEENFCYLPFVQLLLQPTGEISPCCWAQETVLGKLPEDDLNTIWNGPEIRRLRREFLSGEPVQCKSKMRQIGCHRINRGPYTKSTDLSEIQQTGPRRLDVRLNGRCNLQCIMCSVWEQPNGVYDDSDFWRTGAKDIFPYLMELDVLGGEPFVQADTFRLIREVSAVNDTCTWAFVTNGNYNFAAVRKHLEKIRLRWIMVSLDSVVPETYAKIRKGGSLLKTLSTIEGLIAFNEELKQQKRDFDFLISMCVQKDNWQEIEPFLTYCRFVGATPLLQFAYEPSAVSLFSMTVDERLKIRSHMEGLTERHGVKYIEPILRPIVDSLNVEKICE